VSIGELRAALGEVTGLTVAARDQLRLAAERLEEAAAALAELTDRTGEALPSGELRQAGEQAADLAATMAAAADTVVDLGDRL
jgi:t-SNARE complex subunit (syntaxin)